VRAWLSYAGAALAVTVAGAAVATIVVGPATRSAVWFAAALALSVQLVAFAALVGVRGRSQWFLVAWLSGLVARFAVIGLVAFWLAREPVFAREVTLLSLVAFVFVLLLLEPLFLRRGMQAR
jgi:hypothetical protein